MIDIKADVVNALKANANLVTLLGGSNITQIASPDTSVYPHITLFQVTNMGAGWSDNTEDMSEIHLQVDVWSKSNYTAITLEVDNTMKSMQFQRTGVQDLYELDTGVFHCAMRYSTNRFN
jgi:hypothetical protein